MGNLVASHAHSNHFNSFLVLGYNRYSCDSFSHSAREKSRASCISLGAQRDLDFEFRFLNHPGIQPDELTLCIWRDVCRNFRLFQPVMEASTRGNDRSIRRRSNCLHIEKTPFDTQRITCAVFFRYSAREFDISGALPNHIRCTCSGLGIADSLLDIKHGSCNLSAAHF